MTNPSGIGPTNSSYETRCAVPGRQRPSRLLGMAKIAYPVAWKCAPDHSQHPDSTWMIFSSNLSRVDFRPDPSGSPYRCFLR